jgi:hypothetical protein
MKNKVEGHIQKETKKDVLFNGIGIHLIVYALIGMLLLLLGTPGLVIFLFEAVLLWGLFVLAYAFHNRK